jgi:hypothetical protein
MTRKILDVARGHGQMMMKRCGGQQSIDHRQGRALPVRIAGEFAPVIGHGRIDRQQTAGRLLSAKPALCCARRYLIALPNSSTIIWGYPHMR